MGGIDTYIPHSRVLIHASQNLTVSYSRFSAISEGEIKRNENVVGGGEIVILEDAICRNKYSTHS